MRNVRSRAIVAVGVMLAVCSATAHALTASAELGDVSLTVYAPDWTWQKQDINVLVVARNNGSAPADVTLRLDFPAGGDAAFSHAGAREQSITVPPGESVLAAVFPVIGIALLWRVTRPDMGYFRWSPRTPHGAFLIALDCFAVGLSIYIGWVQIGALFADR